ncbi:MAG TPA: galactokinase, partial [Pirellulaceae bacterium]
APSWRSVTLIELANTRAQLSPEQFRLAYHIVSEMDRATRTAEALRQRNWCLIGQEMYSSHLSLRDNFQVSCPEMDLLVEVARELGEAEGVLGSKLTGAGFGGCTVTLVRADSADRAAAKMTSRYFESTGTQPTAFISRPVQGARLLYP